MRFQLPVSLRFSGLLHSGCITPVGRFIQMIQSRRATVLMGLTAAVGIAAALFHVAAAPSAPRVLEIRMRTTAGDSARLSWESGSGTRVQQLPLARTPDGFQVLRFSLPGETARSVRLHPIDRPGELFIEYIRVFDQNGAVVRDLNPRSLVPASQITSMRREGQVVRIVTEPSASDPSLVIAPACLERRSSWHALSSLTPLALALSTCVCLALIVASIAALRVDTSTDPAVRQRTQFTRFIWLTVLFLLIVSAKLLLMHVDPTPVPYLDQWDAEAGGVYIPFHDGCLSWQQMVSFHNEHRIFFTRLLALALLSANGQWDPQLEQVVNAGLHATTALVLAMIFWRASDRRRTDFIILFCAIIFTLPFSWENTLAGFQSSFYFLILFSVLSVALTIRRVGSGAWFLGWLCVVSSLFTTAGGLLTPVATAIAAIASVAFGRSGWRSAAANLGISAAALGLGLMLVSPLLGQSDASKPQSVGELMTALARNLAWPWIDHPWMLIVAWFPLVVLFIVLVKHRADTTDEDVLMFALGSWVVLQAAGLAHARGLGGAAPASRYLDILSLGVLTNAMALTALGRRLTTYRTPQRFVTGVLMAWCVWAIAGVAHIADQGLAGAAVRRTWMADYERNLRSFLKDDDLASFTAQTFPRALPHWNASLLANAWLRHPYIRQILPAAVRSPMPVEPRSDSIAFAENGVYPTTPSDRLRNVLGSYTSVGNPAQGRFESTPLQCAPGSYLRFELAGYVGQPGLSLSVASARHREIFVRPGEVPGERWLTSVVRCPGSPFTVVAVDSRPDLWFGFAEPIEVAWGSQLADGLVQHAWGLLFAAMCITLLATRFG